MSCARARSFGLQAGVRYISTALLLMVLPQSGRAAEPSYWESSASRPVPPGASVKLELDRQEFVLGENVLVHFVLENAGDQAFEAEFGGDYRGATRSLRFKVQAIDQAGRAVEDPNPSETCFGGLGGPRKLVPGDRFTQSLPLMRYCRITEPGRYTIRASHDFGWKEGGRRRPAGEVVVTFRMPTAVEAESLVATMEKLPRDPDNSFGKRSRNYADFSCLRLPVFLEPLRQRAGQGNVEALKALGWIETPEATAALMALASHTNGTLALTAAQTLNLRLPDPALESTNGFGGFPPFNREVRVRLVQRSWRPDFATPVRSLATNYLVKPGVDQVVAGAFMVRCVGTLAEAPAVLEAMDRALDSLVNPRQDPKANILDEPQPLRELIHAMNVLHGQGYSLNEGSLNGQAQILLYFAWLADQPPPRSARWLDLVEAFGPNTRFPVRIAVLNSIPQPLPERCIPFVEGRLSDPDLGVCRTACAVVGRSGNPTFIKPLLEIVATEHHEWLLREASEAATHLGAGFALLETWADRLDEENLYPLALDCLQTIVEGLPGGWSGRTDLTRAERLQLRKQWKDFLARHAGDLRAGKKFKLDDPALRPALFGRARSWQLPDGTIWPTGSK